MNRRIPPTRSRPWQSAFGNGLRVLASALGLMPFSAFGQGSIGFQPTIGSIPDGAILNATPVVSADRRYVRLNVQPQFTGFLGFDTIPVPILVGGGNLGGGGFPSFGPGIGAGPSISAAGYQVPDFAAAGPLMPLASMGEVETSFPPNRRALPRPKARDRHSAAADPDAAMAAAIATATAGKAPGTTTARPTTRRRPRR